MPLSEHEQRLLEQMERALYAEDPKFASTLRGTSFQRAARRRMVLGGAVLVAGIGLLIDGAMQQAAQPGRQSKPLSPGTAARPTAPVRPPLARCRALARRRAGLRA